MTATLLRIDPGAVDATWPRIEKLIAEACERSRGRFSAPIVQKCARDGSWQIWLALNAEGEILAVAGTSIENYLTGLKAIHIRFGTGRNRHSWQHLMEDVVAWGKSQGCTLAEGCFRIGWRRVLPGWTHTHDFLERAL